MQWRWRPRGLISKRVFKKEILMDYSGLGEIETVSQKKKKRRDRDSERYKWTPKSLWALPY